MCIARLLGIADEHCNDEIAKRLPTCGEHHHLPSAPPLHVRNADETKQQVGNGVTGCKQSCKLVVKPDRVDEYGWEIVRGYIDAGKLLHCLCACPEKQAADCLRSAIVARLAAEEVNPSDGVCLFVLYGVDNLLVLGNDEWIVRALVLKIGEDLECFVLVFVGDKPSAA